MLDGMCMLMKNTNGILIKFIRDILSTCALLENSIQSEKNNNFAIQVLLLF